MAHRGCACEIKWLGDIIEITTSVAPNPATPAVWHIQSQIENFLYTRYGQLIKAPANCQIERAMKQTRGGRYITVHCLFLIGSFYNTQP